MNVSSRKRPAAAGAAERFVEESPTVITATNWNLPQAAFGNVPGDGVLLVALNDAVDDARSPLFREAILKHANERACKRPGPVRIRFPDLTM